MAASKVMCSLRTGNSLWKTVFRNFDYFRLRRCKKGSKAREFVSEAARQTEGIVLARRAREAGKVTRRLSS